MWVKSLDWYSQVLREIYQQLKANNRIIPDQIP